MNRYPFVWTNEYRAELGIGAGKRDAPASANAVDQMSLNNSREYYQPSITASMRIAT